MVFGLIFHGKILRLNQYLFIEYHVERPILYLPTFVGTGTEDYRRNILTKF